MKKPKASIAATAVKGATKLGVMITPEQIAASGTEHGHQAAFFQQLVLLRKEDPVWWADTVMAFAIPNGGDRRPSVAASLAAEGVKSGVPDVCYPVPLGPVAGLWNKFKVPGLDLKTNGARQPNQIKWAKDLRAKHYAVCTCYGWRAGIFALTAYCTGTLIMPDDGDALPVVVSD